MATRGTRTPENHIPTDEDLLTLVQRRPGISLREICGEVWPTLRWYGLRPKDDSAAQRVRSHGKTAAAWMRDRMDHLVALGRLRQTRRDHEVDNLAALAYEPCTGGFYAAPPVQRMGAGDKRYGPFLPGEQRKRKKKGEET